MLSSSNENHGGFPMKTGSVMMPELPKQSPLSTRNVNSSPTLPKPCLILPALTGGLLWLCFYPLGWGFLGWVALVPLLFMVRLDARPWQIYVGAYLGGCVFFWTVLQ